jgi:DNA-binding response OmpR family regulator
MLAAPARHPASKVRILVIEDNAGMASAIQRGLSEQGFAVELCATGAEGLARGLAERWDLVVLDRMLPDQEGVEVCRNLRRQGVATPVLMLTALSLTADKVVGLDAGADDYLTKPFEFEELIARVRALARRGRPARSTRLAHEGVVVDLLKRSVERDGEPIKLSAKEFALLEFLVRNPGRVLGRATIAREVWDIQAEPSSNVIEVYVSSLRRKLDRGRAPLIHTVVGEGYRFGRLADSARQAGA